MDHEFEDLFGQMRANQSYLQKQATSIAQNPDLSDEGKLRELARAYSTAEVEHDKLLKEYDNLVASRKSAIEEKLYRHPSAFLYASDENKRDMRELVFRAEEALKNKTIGTFIERAHKLKDAAQVRAGIIVAYDNKRWDLLQTYREFDEAASEMIDWEATFGTLASAETKLYLSMKRTAPKRPAGVPIEA